MKNTELTDFTPGAHLMTCRAGRSVSAVEWMAPETRPSTSPIFSIMVPSITLSANAARACSSVMPFDLRSSTSVGTYFSASSAVGSIISISAGSSTPCSLATLKISSFLPTSTGTAIFLSITSFAAWTVRGSEPSGSTIRFLALEALRRRPARNMAWLVFLSSGSAARSAARHLAQRSRRLGQNRSASSLSEKIFASSAVARASLNFWATTSLMPWAPATTTASTEAKSCIRKSAAIVSMSTAELSALICAAAAAPFTLSSYSA